MKSEGRLSSCIGSRPTQNPAIRGKNILGRFEVAIGNSDFGTGTF